ncbi:MAG: hypothetical protein GWM90_01115, partial [Gemmatimonadetes bacterium]|nr:hypothetical protein [Gemmatimonadota bacterium]NIQ52171.1 hypothetical protein [Gemmatimonadota bacterium]NIU72274.1 hypothetical protein [Gammaproteobacteria bacterium]NIX42779.1 hypothetical protein [Gemmatimonadota bacterium]NIY06945.1 hypothetical protein [Gemmatimonadota bacterium]
MAAVAVHNLLLRGSLDPFAMGLLAAGLGAYGLVTWLTQRPARRPGGWSPVLVVADLAAMAAAVYIAGADQSWLFWVFVLRVLDPDLTPGRALGVAAMGTGAYLAVIAWVDVVDGGTVAWGVEAAKLAFLALGGTYAALAIGAAARDRARLATEAGRAGRSAGARHSARRRELERAGAEMRAESLAKSRFLARVSHEVRSPVAAIVGLAQELEQAPLSEDDMERVHRITERGQHLLDVLNEVLDLARVEMGSLDVGPVHLEPALRDVLVRARRGAERRRISLPDEPPPGSDVWVTANDRKLRQVFANLVSNAIKYNSSPGEIRLACDDSQGVVRVSVTDSGPGIAPDRVAAAFRPFDRLGAETTGVRGTGLGLTVARSLAEAMGGRLGVDTHPESGSTFWFELERAEPAPEPEPTPEEERGPTVLYIGSQPENLMLVRRILD